MAGLQTGWEILLQYGLAVGALGGAERDELEQRMGRALGELAALQAPYQQASDPARRFVTLLRAALAGGRAHVADRRGKAPAEAALWGWQRPSTGRGWVPRGTRMGWVAGSDLYLEPAASYQVAQQVAGAERLAVSEQTLRHRLGERGLLASIDAGREMLQVRRTLNGSPRQVLHLKSSALLGQVSEACRVIGAAGDGGVRKEGAAQTLAGPHHSSGRTHTRARVATAGTRT